MIYSNIANKLHTHHTTTIQIFNRLTQYLWLIKN